MFNQIVRFAFNKLKNPCRIINYSPASSQFSNLWGGLDVWQIKLLEELLLWLLEGALSRFVVVVVVVILWDWHKILNNVLVEKCSRHYCNLVCMKRSHKQKLKFFFSLDYDHCCFKTNDTLDSPVWIVFFLNFIFIIKALPNSVLELYALLLLFRLLLRIALVAPTHQMCFCWYSLKLKFFEIFNNKIWISVLCDDLLVAKCQSELN